MRRSHAVALALLTALALAGCTRAKDVLEPSAIKPPHDADMAAAFPGDVMAPAQSSTPAQPNTPGQSSAALSRTRLQIAPIVGATVEAATPLTERLALRAREQNITLVGSAAGQLSTLMLKGYFSAVTEGADTTVIYVWDLYDAAGNRLHRINGQQKAPSVSGGDGWTAVAPATMQAIADATISQLAAWLASRPG